MKKNVIEKKNTLKLVYLANGDGNHMFGSERSSRLWEGATSTLKDEDSAHVPFRWTSPICRPCKYWWNPNWQRKLYKNNKKRIDIVWLTLLDMWCVFLTWRMSTGEAFPALCDDCWVSSTMHFQIGVSIWKAAPKEIWTWSAFENRNVSQECKYNLKTDKHELEITNS